jgi:predicted amidophosphoribosyltransferase
MKNCLMCGSEFDSKWSFCERCMGTESVHYSKLGDNQK